MAACEKCWADAYGRVQDHPAKSQAEHYQDLLEERKFNSCTPEQQKGNNMTKQTLDKGIPDCPECDGNGMCIEHRVEFLRHEYEVTSNAYEFVMNEYIKILKLRISKNAYRDELNLQNTKNNPEPKTERNKNEKL